MLIFYSSRCGLKIAKIMRSWGFEGEFIPAVSEDENVQWKIWPRKCLHERLSLLDDDDYNNDNNDIGN